MWDKIVGVAGTTAALWITVSAAVMNGIGALLGGLASYRRRRREDDYDDAIESGPDITPVRRDSDDH